MKKSRILFSTCLVLSSLLLACYKNHKMAEFHELNGRGYYSCNLDNSEIPVSELKLSSIVEEPKLILFDDSPESLFGFWRCAISDNYIGMCTPHNKFQIFDHNGRYIRSIGNIGHGPGEYINIYGACIDEKNGFVYLADMMTRRLSKYTLEGVFVGWLNDRPFSKTVLRCDKTGTLQVVNIPFAPDDVQFMIAPLNTTPKYYQAALDVPTRDKDGNFTGFNNEIWAYNNTSELSYQISCSDTLYAFNYTDSINYPLITAKAEGKYPFYNDINEYFLVSVYDEQTPDEIYWIKKKNGEITRGKMINDYLFGMPVKNATFCFKDGWYYQFFESFDLESQLKDLLKEGKLSQLEQTKVRELIEKARNANQGMMLLGRIK